MSASPLAGPPATSRTPLHVDVDRGRLETGGRWATFGPATPDDVLIAYLKLVRRLRDVEREPSLVLRRDDVVVLAEALREDAVVVLDRLGELMGATVTQRRTMVTAFLAGALLIAVATGATALAPGDRRDPAPSATSGGRSEAVIDRSAPRPVDDDGSPAADATDADPAADAGTSGPGATTTPDVVGTSGTGAASAPDAVAAAPAPGVAAGGSSGPVDPPSGGAPPAGRAPQEAEAEAGAGDPASTSPAADGVPGDRAPMRWSTGPEVVQPGATIDIPNDPEVDPGEDEVDVPVTLPVVEVPEVDPPRPVVPPQD